MDRMPKERDIISSEKFVRGCRSFDGSDVVEVGYRGPTVVEVTMTEGEIRDYVAKNGNYPANTSSEVDFAAFDTTRATAKYVVIEIFLSTNDSRGNPDSLHVKAKKLTADGKWDKNGEVISFCATSGFSNSIEPVDLHFFGEMDVIYT